MRAAGRDLPEGAVVGGTYVLGQRLGSGGHGSVFAARHARTGAEVALKLLDVEDADATQRLLREARLAMRLTHPSIVRVLDAAVGPDGLPYVAYERLVGAPLDQWIAGQPLGEERALDVIRPLLGALAEAHHAGIVHRDVKPENVFLCTPDQTGKPLVKLLDFGVAKAVFSRSIQTASGLVLGTPLYMAPEQMTGEAVGPWTDLYAVGLVLAELLGGQPVFEPSLAALIAQKTSEAPVPLAPRVRSSALAPVVERAIRRWPAQRWASAEEMLAALEERSRPAAPKRQPKTVPMPAQPAPKTDPFAATLGRAEIERAMAERRAPRPPDALNATVDEREAPRALEATVGERPRSGAPRPDTPAPPRRDVARTIALFVVLAVLSFGAVVGGMALVRRLRRGDAAPPAPPPGAVRLA